MSMLPKEKSARVTDMCHQTIFLYGPRKIGKSTFCSNIDDALFFATEQGLNHLDVFKVDINSWAEMLAAAKEFASTKHKFTTLIIDTADNAYQWCADWICQQHHITHPQDMKYGKGTALVNNEFRRVLNKLASLPYGLWLTSHSKEKEIETDTQKRVKVIPTLPESTRKIVLGMADMILLADIELTEEEEGEEGQEGERQYRRIIRSQPSRDYEAGDRTGFLPPVLPLDYIEFKKIYEIGAKTIKSSKGAKKKSNSKAAGKKADSKKADSKKTGTKPETESPPAEASEPDDKLTSVKDLAKKAGCDTWDEFWSSASEACGEKLGPAEGEAHDLATSRLTPEQLDKIEEYLKKQLEKQATG